MSETSSSSDISERREDSPQEDNELSSNAAAIPDSQTSTIPSSASTTPPVTSEESGDESDEQSLPDLEFLSLNEETAQDNIPPGTHEENAREDALQDNVPNGNTIQVGESSNTTAIQDSQMSAPPSSTPPNVPDPSTESEEAVEEQSVTARSACVTPDTPAKDEEGGARAARTLDSCSPIYAPRRPCPPFLAQSKDGNSQLKLLADESDNQEQFMAEFIEKWEMKKRKRLRPSPGDGPGVLYTFNTAYKASENCWKVGRTTSMTRRQKEHERKFPRIQKVTDETAMYHKLAEKIAHHLLEREEGRTMWIKGVKCSVPKCKVKNHKEFYTWKPEVEWYLKVEFRKEHKDAKESDEIIALLIYMWEAEVKYAMKFAIDEVKKEKYQKRK